MIFKSIKISTRLLFGFSIILILICSFGITALFQIKTLANYSVKMYNHPMVVSNSVREIERDIALIHMALQDLIYEKKDYKYFETIKKTHFYESEIESNFKIIKARFLGDVTDIELAYESFSELRPIINQILMFLENNNKDEAIKLKKGKSELLLQELSQRVKVMSDFAENKGEEFYLNAKNGSNTIFKITIYFLLLIFFLSFIIGTIISISITKPLNYLIKHVNKLSVGDYENVINSYSDDEVGQLTMSVEEMQIKLIEVTSHAGKIAKGNYSGEISPRSSKDELAISLNKMTQSLRNLKMQNEYQDWLKTGQNILNDNMRGDLEINSLASNIITSLAEYVNAKLGAIYIYDERNRQLNLSGSYAYTLRKGVNEKIKIGEGIVGQCALEKKVISITDIPDDYIRISSSLGDAAPKNIIAFPFLFESELKGVIELATFTEWKDKEIEFLTNIADIIGISFSSAEARNRMKELLIEQQEQSKELLAQQEELKAANEELEEKTESLILSEERLQAQQNELKATNEELEEKTEFLEKQRDEIDRKNQELEIVKDDIIQKARDLEISSKYKSEFLANMSHELRTPLNSLLILAKDLYSNKGNRLNSDDVKSAEIIYNSGNELLQLINEILDLAKIESGKINLNIQNIEIEDLANNVNNIFENLAKNKSINLDIIIDKSIEKSILSDKQKVNQIIKNLVSNAIKFTKEGSVSVTFTKPSPTLHLKSKVIEPTDYIVIEVKDTGIGIAENKTDTVFEAFKQADGSTSREFGGTGLGLSISKELASLLGGEIVLQSKINEGSIFSLVLPIQLNYTENIKSDIFAEMEDIRIKSDKQVMITNKNGYYFIEDDREIINENDRLILIVEDDRNFATVLQNTCKEHNFKSVITDSGEDALILVNKYKPDAIILDIKLPGISGLQVLDKLKKNNNTRHIPVHIISGDDRKEDVLDKGIIGFLKKPITNDSLHSIFDKINSFIDKKSKDLLIIEDDDNLRHSIEKLIGNNDVIKTSVSTGKEALNELKKNTFDCIILDLTLPDMSGQELLYKLDNMNLSQKPPVIVYTGREIGYDEEYELRKHTSSIIIKGVNSEERLLDETALFLHRVIKNLPEKKQQMISNIYNSEKVFKNKTILIVDDDMRNVFAISKILEDYGMTVEKAPDGEKALDILEMKGDHINLILMDIMMPVMDGYETMKRIRNIKKFNSMPILAITAKAMKEDRHKCIEAGANDYMTKPIDPERLLSMMRVWLYK